MRRVMLGLSVAMVLSGSIALAADAPHGAAATAPHAATHVEPASHQPALPEPSVMPGLVLIGILALFVWAAAIGPVVRYHTPEEPPEPSAHDDHGHGAHHAQGHGHGGH